MKRKIYENFVLLSTLAILITSIFLLYFFYDFYSAKERQHIKNYADILAKSIENSQYPSIENVLNEFYPNIRISLIKNNGEIIFDTVKESTIMENHLNRKEVQDALEKGTGESIRYSTTLEQDTYYYAIQLSNSNILRVALETNNMFSVFITISPGIIMAIIILLLLALFVSSLLAKKILSPIENITNNIDRLIISNKLNTVEIYDELLPFVTTLAKQSREIQSHIDDITEKANIMNVITNNMQEGLILIDEEKHIISTNKSSIELLNGSIDKSYISQSFISLCRDIDLNKKIQEAIKTKKNNRISMNLSNKFIHIFINPILNHEELVGLVLLLVDSTKEHMAELIRREFSANVSHELKTPLTSINGYAEMIENEMAQGDNVKLFASIIRKEGTRLLNLINSIIKLSKLEDESIQNDMEYLDIYLLGKNIVSNISFLAQEKNIVLQSNGKEALVYVNKIMIEELIYNLLDNSIKYTNPGGSIKLEIYKEEYGIIKITDTGIGIDVEHQDRIFERFFMVDKNRSRKVQGSGLGLSIVKHIVEYHNGTIDLKSKINEGTEITIKI